ncbi:MAG TPA: HAMP domain-containing histidine kinase [Cytophagales bacterium]|nr:HAMP domain-containing histidine kinase [Cytophagales bacterium]
MIALKENHEKIKWVVSITTILFMGSLIFFSIKIISEIKEREITAIKRYANFLQYISSNKESPDYYIDEIIIDNNNIPVIITDENYNIIDHKNIIYSDNESKKSQILNKTLSSMKNGYEPIEVLIYDSNNVIVNKQFVFYKNSEILDLIILTPYYLSLFILIILISIYLIFYYSNASEKDRLWTGLAKETAHQLGTPLSSLIAWKEYIKSKNILNDKNIIVEIEKDLERLKIITDRFSNIGSKPIIKEEELKNLINNSIKYLKKRVSKNILFIIQGENILHSVNKELFSWVIENLFKNSIDAIGESGKIKIILHKKSNKILIDFIDNGNGIKNSNFRKIFDPGFTTKKRGWGLGLTLVHRIITNYHNGKIFVLKSIKNVETIIRIEFKL